VSSEPISFSLREKFGRDVLWNLVSFAIMGVSGILLNILIGRFYGAAAMGIFNQVFALYILASQLGAFGIHYSTLRYVSEYAETREECDRIISAALFLTLLCTSAVTLVAFLLAGWLGWAFDSEGLVVGWYAVLPGLWCFALNKVLLAILNGLRHMRAFALAQAGRYVLMIVALMACVGAEFPAERLAIVISVGEVTIFVGLLLYLFRLWRPRLPGDWRGWLRQHAFFGAKSFLGGTMVELNTRVDVLMLGLFMSDAFVGLYSMASMLAEGFAQLSVVLRNNVNPLITKHMKEETREELQALVRRIWKNFTLVSVTIGLIAVAGYPIFVDYFLADATFHASFPVFAILVAGIALASGYLPFNMFLLQADKPGLHTGFMLAVVCSNIVLNAALIPLWGIQGAALATAAAYVLSVLYLKWIVRRSLGLRI
jgi:O-antigen/teichoic acid export membrane protein